MIFVMDLAGFRLGRGQNDRAREWRGAWAKGKKERKRVHDEIFARYSRFGASAKKALRRDVGPGPWAVTIVRISPSAKGLDEHDNLRASCKRVVDEIAKWLGVDDGDRTRVEWRYAQERGPWAVKIRIESAEEGQGA